MTGAELRILLDRALDLVAKNEDELRDLDSAIGDGDLGITVSRGAEAARKSIAAMPSASTPSEIIRTLATTIASANPSSFTALVATGLLAASRSVTDRESLTAVDVLTMAQQAVPAIAKRGKAEVGDKTVLDALVPSVAALEANTSEGALDAMIAAARKGIDDTAGGVSRKGRAAWLGERTIGHPDPGATAYLRFLEALERARSELRA
ncbi:MAG TPA: dihydroxyacetone kinase subunit DhaL [Candidatus Limnocylindria bacterium]|nr:dihydroxyacetone kinase subunit L [Chloroflexota bacterium]